MRAIFYIGTYTGTGSQGIYQGVFDTTAQTLKISAAYPEHVENPSFLAVTENHLYAVNELQVGGAVTVYERNAKDGGLKFLNRFPTEGSGMCHVRVWPGQRHLSLANYNSGSMVVCALDEKGTIERISEFRQHYGIGYDKDGRQEGPHVHSTGISKDGRFLYVADLGMDQLFCYCVKEDGSLEPAPDRMQVKVPAGEGPRHFVFTPDQNYLYLVTEMGNRLHVLRREEESKGYVEVQSVTTIPEGNGKESFAADIHFSWDHRYLYVSNRGENCITGYRVDDATGKVACIGYFSSCGVWPRNFCITPDDNYMLIANQYTDNVVLCNRNRETGKIGEQLAEVKIPQPVFVTVARRPEVQLKIPCKIPVERI